MHENYFKKPTKMDECGEIASKFNFEEDAKHSLDYCEEKW